MESHYDQVLAFRQIDYLWLFDPYLNFKARNISDENQLTIEDYQRMKIVNRLMLSQFL